jgi:hypothetical protein
VSASTEGLPAGHYLSLEIVPTIARCAVFQVLVLHIPDGNVIALEQLILSPSTTTQTLPYAGWGQPFCVRHLCTFQQRYYRPGSHLARKIFSCSFEQCNPFPDVSKTL